MTAYVFIEQSPGCYHIPATKFTNMVALMGHLKSGPRRHVLVDIYMPSTANPDAPAPRTPSKSLSFWAGEGERVTL